MAVARRLIFLLPLIFWVNQALSQPEIRCLQNLTITTWTGDQTTSTCQPSSSKILFRTNTVATFIGFLVTDTQNIILSVSLSPRIDFSNIPSKNLKVYAYSYLGTSVAKPGGHISSTQLATRCYELSKNFVSILNSTPDAGELIFNSNTTEITLCQGDGYADLIAWSTSSLHTPYEYEISNESQTFKIITEKNQWDFEMMEPGIYRIKGIARSGCSGISSNFLIVNLRKVNAGKILPDEIVVCNDSKVSFSNTGYSQSNFEYILTNEDQDTLSVSELGEFDFSNFPPGQYRVYGRTYENSSLLSCSKSTDDFALIDVKKVDGGILTTDSVFICSGQSPFNIALSRENDAPLANYRYILANKKDEPILGLLGSQINSSILPEGEYHIWGLSFTGSLQLQGDEKIQNQILSTECYDLSISPLVIIKEITQPFQISFKSGLWSDIICPGESVELDVEKNYPGSVKFRITDENDSILEETTLTVFNFSDYTPGTYKVIGIGYVGEKCETVSQNFLSVKIQIPDPGIIEPEERQTGVVVSCDPFYFTQLSGENTDSIAYLISDTAGLVKKVFRSGDIDFSGLPTGNYRILGLAFSGNLSFEENQPLESQLFSSGCFTLTPNEIPVFFMRPEGGILTTDLYGEDSKIYTCLLDGKDDLITVIPQNHSLLMKYSLILTDKDNKILSVLTNPQRNYENNVLKELKIYGVSHFEDLIIQMGTSIFSINDLNSCIDFAEAPLEIFSDRMDGGILEDLDTDEICGDLILNTSSKSLTGYAFVLTDTVGNLIQWQESSYFNLEGIPNGNYEIYGLNFGGEFENPTCSERSSNTLKFKKLGNVNAGLIFAENEPSDTIYTCPEYGGPDVIILNSVGASKEAAYKYVLTDTADIILYPQLDPDGFLDFNNGPPGIYRARGISYTGDFNGQGNRDIKTLELSNECFEYTPNFLTILHLPPKGGKIKFKHTEENIASTLECGGSELHVEVNGHSGNYAILIDKEGIIEKVFKPGELIETQDCMPRRATGIAFTGNLPDLIGSNIHEIEFENCFEFSENVLGINGEVPPLIGISENEKINSIEREFQDLESFSENTGQIRAYPNPTIGEITFLSENPGKKILEIWDLKGSKIISYPTYEMKVIINLNELVNSGIYFAGFSGEEKVKIIFKARD